MKSFKCKNNIVYNWANELDKASLQQVENIGIIRNMININDLDEASGAYKNIETVIANQADLVKIVTKLFPLAVIKG